MQENAVGFILVGQVQMETLNVKPTVLLEVEDSTVLLVDFSVAVRPHAGLFKPEQWVHARSEKMRMIVFPEEIRKC